MHTDAIPLTDLRANLGKYAHRVWFHGDRFLVTKGRREMMALVRVPDLELVNRVERVRPDIRAWDLAKEMLRFRVAREEMYDLRAQMHDGEDT